MRRTDRVGFIVKALTNYLFTASDGKKTVQARNDAGPSTEQPQQQLSREEETMKMPVDNREG